MDFAIPKEWENFLSNELKKEYVLSLKLRLKKEKALHKKIFPSEREIFKAFELTSPEKTKVIIIGQDPYHKVVTISAFLRASSLFVAKDTNFLEDSKIFAFGSYPFGQKIDNSKFNNLAASI